jgi:hypothetical protein
MSHEADEQSAPSYGAGSDVPPTVPSSENEHSHSCL